MSKKSKIKEVFTKIKEAHSYWKNGDMFYQDRLEKALEPSFLELEKLGVDRTFSRSLLFFGKDFVDRESATDEEIKEVFGELVPMTDREIREIKLARKHGIACWQSVKTLSGKVRIKAL